MTKKFKHNEVAVFELITNLILFDWEFDLYNYRPCEVSFFFFKSLNNLNSEHNEIAVFELITNFILFNWEFYLYNYLPSEVSFFFFFKA